MNRSSIYNERIAAKLLCSKFTYSMIGNLLPLKSIFIKPTIKSHNPEVGSANIAVVFGRKPAFIRYYRQREKEYRLVHLLLTSHKKRILFDLEHLVNTILPFQLSNQIAELQTFDENGMF